MARAKDHTQPQLSAPAMGPYFREGWEGLGEANHLNAHSSQSRLTALLPPGHTAPPSVGQWPGPPTCTGPTPTTRNKHVQRRLSPPAAISPGSKRRALRVLDQQRQALPRHFVQMQVPRPQAVMTTTELGKAGPHLPSLSQTSFCAVGLMHGPNPPPRDRNSSQIKETTSKHGPILTFSKLLQPERTKDIVTHHHQAVQP